MSVPPSVSEVDRCNNREHNQPRTAPRDHNQDLCFAGCPHSLVPETEQGGQQSVRSEEDHCREVEVVDKRTCHVVKVFVCHV